MSDKEVLSKDERCMDCDGRGYNEVAIICMGCDDSHEHEKPPHIECRTCHGSGRLIGLARAIRIARGGPAPIPMRGFA